MKTSDPLIIIRRGSAGRTSTEATAPANATITKPPAMRLSVWTSEIASEGLSERSAAVAAAFAPGQLVSLADLLRNIGGDSESMGEIHD